MRRVRGNKFVETTLRVTTHPVDGSTSMLVIEGEAADVQGLQASYGGAQTTFEQTDGFGRLEVLYANQAATGQNEVPILRWSLDGAQQQKDLFEHRAALALSDATIDTLQEKLRANTKAERDAVTIPQVRNAQALYDLYHRGTTAFYADDGIVMRKTMTVSTNYELSIAFSGLAMVMAGADFISTEPTMPTWARTLVTFLDDRADSVNEFIPPSGYVFGWLKHYPTIDHTFGGRVELSQEWWGAIWKVQGDDDDLVYPIYSP